MSKKVFDENLLNDNLELETDYREYYNSGSNTISNKDVKPNNDIKEAAAVEEDNIREEIDEEDTVFKDESVFEDKEAEDTEPIYEEIIPPTKKMTKPKANKPKNNNTNKPKKTKSFDFKKTLVAIGITIAVILVAYVGVAYGYYGNRFLPNTKINGVNKGGAKTTDVINEIEAAVDSYSLFIYNDEHAIDEITGTIINMEAVDSKKIIEGYCNSQNKLGWAISFFGKGQEFTTEDIITYDEEKLNASVTGSNAYDIEPTMYSVNANIEYNGKEFVVKPSEIGDEIDKERLGVVVAQAVKKLQNKLVIEESDTYVKPLINEEDERLTLACDKANDIINKNISMVAFETEIPVDKNEVGKWITVNENVEVVPDEESILEYIISLQGKYTTYGKDREFKTSYGTTVTVKGGDYGRELDITNLKTDIPKVITDEDTNTFNLVFSKTAMGDLENDLGDTYAEIDLTNQRMFMYSEGKLVIQTDIVTGRKDGVHETPQGTYKLKYKKSPDVLDGPGYSTPVAYWMPFNGDIGMHDATWQPRFGGDRWIYGGSHGCVNLPLKAAKTIYSHAVVGMPVICYFTDSGLAAPNTEPVTQATTKAQTSTPAASQPVQNNNTQAATQTPVTQSQPTTQAPVAQSEPVTQAPQQEETQASVAQDSGASVDENTDTEQSDNNVVADDDNIIKEIYVE